MGGLLTRVDFGVKPSHSREKEKLGSHWDVTFRFLPRTWMSLHRQLAPSVGGFSPSFVRCFPSTFVLSFSRASLPSASSLLPSQNLSTGHPGLRRPLCSDLPVCMEDVLYAALLPGVPLSKCVPAPPGATAHAVGKPVPCGVFSMCTASTRPGVGTARPNHHLSVADRGRQMDSSGLRC